MQTLTLALAVACALMGGIFFTFSTFVMTALGNLKPSEGMRAMQRINIDVLCWPFSVLFFGLPAALLATAIYAIVNHSQTNAHPIVAATATYWAGTFLLTMLANVPLNNELARTDSEQEGSNAAWEHYLVYWVRWNHLRTLACIAASILLLLQYR